METSRYAEGTRVEIERGSYPLQEELIGRTGLVVEVDPYRPRRYGVQLDGEEEVRDFAEDELLPLTDEPKPVETRGSAGPALD